MNQKEVTNKGYDRPVKYFRRVPRSANINNTYCTHPQMTEHTGHTVQ
jgi:hypothetical protein